MKTLLFIVSLFALVGCASEPSPRAKADSCVKPIIVALHAYHHDSGDYPRQLDELRPHYLEADVPVFEHTDAEHLWVCYYDRIDQNHYSLQFYKAPCSEAIYKNGKFIEAWGPAFRPHPIQSP